MQAKSVEIVAFPPCSSVAKFACPDMRVAEDILIRQLRAFAPRSILAVGDRAGGLVSGYCTDHPDCELVLTDSGNAVASLAAAPATRRYDFGVTAGYLETVDKETGGSLIARLRDVLVRRLCVVIPVSGQSRGTNWTDAEMIAFGLSILDEESRENGGYRMYGFDIASYKKTPDWLNPRHWANPERWNKERW